MTGSANLTCFTGKVLYCQCQHLWLFIIFREKTRSTLTQLNRIDNYFMKYAVNVTFYTHMHVCIKTMTKLGCK